MYSTRTAIVAAVEQKALRLEHLSAAAAGCSNKQRDCDGENAITESNQSLSALRFPPIIQLSVNSITLQHPLDWQKSLTAIPLPAQSLE